MDTDENEECPNPESNFEGWFKNKAQEFIENLPPIGEQTPEFWVAQSADRLWRSSDPSKRIPVVILEMFKQTLLKRIEDLPTYEDFYGIGTRSKEFDSPHQLREDALNWRALMSCARMTSVGSAGLDSDLDGNYAHVTLNFWSLHPEHEKEDDPARKWLSKFAQKCRAIQKEQNGDHDEEDT